VHRAERLILSHLWLAFAAFGVAVVLGAWQMGMRTPYPAPLENSDLYYLSVTAHGVLMAYVMTTLFAMGFGYAVATSSLDEPLRYPALAWTGFAVSAFGAVLALATIIAGRASVLYTFYPPLLAHAGFYIGLTLLFAGSWIWAGLMVVTMFGWKRRHWGQPVPLVMFATVATALLWLWTSVGVAAELVFQLIPAALGVTDWIDVGLARTLFSWTLHAIVYFWLLPAYIGFYTLLPQAAGGRLYSDTMGRVTFIVFLVVSTPVGLHHLLVDPEHGAGFKFLQSVFTFVVAVPTLLTVFTITASLEVAGRIRGGRGPLGWIAALPWHEPMVLASVLSFIMLGFGGLGGLVNMSFGMNAMIHNTAFVTAHFHLIFGGTTVLMYMAIAYTLWPELTGHRLVSGRLARVQIWGWFIGMMLLTIPWHATGLMGQPRRMSGFDYSVPEIARLIPLVDISFVGGLFLVASAMLFLWVLLRSHRGMASAERLRFATAVNPPHRVPGILNGFAVWNVLALLLMVANYGWPVAQFFVRDSKPVPVYRVDTTVPELAR